LYEDIKKYEENPDCPCNWNIYKNVIKHASKELKAYWGEGEVVNVDDLVKPLENNFSVINCKISELESKLKALPMGRKQLAMARYQDEITVIVNELDI
jgi:hypothetical protein